jgi:hypothetical protein
LSSAKSSYVGTALSPSTESILKTKQRGAIQIRKGVLLGRVEMARDTTGVRKRSDMVSNQPTHCNLLHGGIALKNPSQAPAPLCTTHIESRSTTQPLR